MKFWPFSRRQPPPPPRERRPRPPDWHKTIDDLMSEKRTIPAEEIEWARAYERDALKKWARFPKDREEYEAASDVEVQFLTHWQAPYTGGGKGMLPKGSRVRVSVSERDPEPIVVYAQPLDSKRLEAEWVPAADRSSAKYGGFSLSIPVGQLNKDFLLVE